MDSSTTLLLTAFRHVISEPSIEAAFERFQDLTGVDDYEAFRDAVATCLQQGLIREPVRLPEGALQCHWHLELTPKGVEAARSIVRAGRGRRSPSLLPEQYKVMDDRGKPGHDG